MAKTEYKVPEIGTVFITKKRGQRTMRLRVDSKGLVQVSMPWIVPNRTAIDFILNKKDWIKQQQESYEFRPYNGMLFGKTLRIIIKENSTNLRTTYTQKDVIVHFGGIYDPFNPNQTLKVQKSMMKALRSESEKILLPRLRELADMYGFSYASS